MRLAGALLLYLVALAWIPVHPDVLWVERLDFGIAVHYPARAFLDGLDPYDQSAYRAAYPVQAGGCTPARRASTLRPTDQRCSQAFRKRGLKESIPTTENSATVLGVFALEYSTSKER